jgi:hypothetical protein
MAHHPPDTELRRGSLSGIKLPSFQHLVSGLDHGPFPKNEILRPPPIRADPLEHARNGMNDSHHHTEHRSSFHSQPHLTTSVPSHYDEGRSRGSTQAQGFPETHREDRSLPPNPRLAAPVQEARSWSAPQSPYHQGQNPTGNRVVVAEKTIDGKDWYEYDDGSICQKIINGDTVNPKWGTTKAGKPRKRLGQACNTCREKKIRCDGQPKCAQCQKVGRECRFEQNPRSSRGGSQQAPHKDSMSSRGSQNDTRHERTGSSTSAEALTENTYSRANSRSSMNVEHLLSPSSTVAVSPPNEQPPAKRARLSPPKEGNDAVPVAAKARQSSSPKQKHFAWDVDPYEVDPHLTMRHAKVYVSVADSYVYTIFPGPQFLNWVEHSRSKKDGEIMLMYAILATAMAFSPVGHDETYRYQFKNIAEVALDRRRGCRLQSIRTQLLLAMVEYGCGELEKSKAWSISALKLAYESGLHEEVSVDTQNFGLDLAAHLESRRRTFWLAFTSVSFHSSVFGNDYPVQPLTCSLRLPCDDELFKKNELPATPLLQYRPDAEVELPWSSNCGSMAFLVEAMIITNEAVGWLYADKSDISRHDYSRDYERIHNETHRRLWAWDIRIRSHYNLQDSKSTGLHVLYYFVLMMVNRHVRHAYLTSEQVERNARGARSNAIQLLELIHALLETPRADLPMSNIALDCPMAGHAIYLAIDILTSAGTIRSLLDYESDQLSLPEMIYTGMEALERLSTHWKTAEKQLNNVKPRMKSVTNHTTLGTSSRKAAFFVRHPLLAYFGLEDDVVYGISRLRYLRALGYGDMVRSDDDICEMGIATNAGTPTSTTMSATGESVEATASRLG